MAFVPAMLVALSVPMFMMGTHVRTGIGVVMVALALWMLWRAHQSGWTPNRASAAEHEVHIEPA